MTSQAKRLDIYGAEGAARGWRPWGAVALVLALVFIVAPAIAATLALHRIGLVDANAEPVGAMGFVAFLLIPFSMTGLLVLGWVKLAERRSNDSIGMGEEGWLSGYGGGWLLGLAMAGGVVAAIILAGGFRTGDVAPAFADPGALIFIAVLAIAFAVQAGAEELLFRGWLLSALTWRWGLLAGVSASSLLFTLLHFDPSHHWLMNVNMFAFSLFASALALWGRGAWVAMGWHGAWNWLLAVGFETPITGIEAKVLALVVATTPKGPDVLHGAGAGPEGSLITTIVFLAGAVVLLVVRAVRARPAAARDVRDLPI